MDDPTITTDAQLDALLGAAPKALNLKILREIDSHAERWLQASPLLFVGFAHAAGVGLTLAGGEPGFSGVRDPRSLVLPLASLDDASHVTPGQGVGLLSLVAGLGETLRINGRVARVEAGSVLVDIDEVYLQCAKALIRSDFWNAPARTDLLSQPEAYLQQARFVAVGTCDAQGNADVSPKGDPAGTMLYVDGNEVGFGERPGNRRKDSLKNLLTQPRLTVAALIPGGSRVALIAGTARLQTRDDLRARLEVAGKRPKLVTSICDARITLLDSPALQRIGWPLPVLDHGIDPMAVFTAHMKHKKQRGLAGLAQRALSKRLLGAGLAVDYKKNLY